MKSFLMILFLVSVPLRGFWYSDFNDSAKRDIFTPSSFSPLTGILVLRLCLPVPAPRLGSQAIFSNLRLFWPFSLTRVKNKNQAVSFIRLVMPFFAVFEIFKPTGFLALKTIFQRSVVLWLISSIRFSSFVVKRPPGKGVPLNFSNIPLIWP